MSQLLDECLLTGFVALVPQLAVEMDLSRPFVTWTVGVVPLIVSSFLLAFGRLVDVYGGFSIYLGGLAWTLIWSLIATLAKDRILLVCCRAMQGFGSAAHLSAGLAMLGTFYGPDPRKNMIFSFYGAMAPLGSFLGIAVGGIVSEYMRWQWYFWITAMLPAIPLLSAWLTTPRQRVECMVDNQKIDWFGCITISTGILLLVFAVTELPHAPQGLRTLHIIIAGLFSLLSLGCAVYVEGWVAKYPLLPFSVLKVQYVRPLLIGLLLNYGTIGVYMLYATLYIRKIIGVGPLELVAWFAPMAIGGFTLALCGGILMHLVPLTSGLLALGFPAMIFATVSIDLIFNRANIFLSDAMPKNTQGLAGGLSNTLVHLSIAIQLGFAEVVAAKTVQKGKATSYKNVFWFAVACGASALVVFTLFVRVGTATSESTEEEKESRGHEYASLEEVRETTSSAGGRRSTASIDIVDYKGNV
ncbi:hypothetical protein Q7P37_007612 [Cladosporium fusiforme]